MKTFLKYAVSAIALAIFLSGCNNDHEEPVTVQTQATIEDANADHDYDTLEQHCDGHSCYYVRVHHHGTHVTATPPPKPHVDVPSTFPVENTDTVKRAVLVGVNKYKDPSCPPLHGCVPDIARIKNYCIVKWGFKPENIVVLLDEQATVENVKNALNTAVKASKADDTLLYWQSSHGADDVIDGAVHQFVCCHDFTWDRAHELCDLDFVEIFKALPPGVIFNWGSDSCHSGDLDRNVHKHPKALPKSPPPPDGVKIAVKKARINGAATKELINGLLNVGYISGCGKDETSADSYDDDGTPAGALTLYFCKTWDANQTANLVDLGKKINKSLDEAGYDQNPTVSGARKNKPWLKN